ncbi:MAG: hypothetical protein ABFS12_08610 [Bacteroidota bacterium]
MSKNKQIQEKITKVDKTRAEFSKIISKNPNYFGTHPETKLKQISKMSENTKYEELKCIGFYPELDLLEAVIDVKLPSGYNGNLCSHGSFEYVSFFIDWDNDGDFSGPDEYLGIANVNVHDISDTKKVCLDKTKPLSYALTLQIDSKKKPCKIPNLVKVKAILSWNNPPDPGNPNFVPVWGNSIEKWIQIKPAKYLMKDLIDYMDLKELDLLPTMFDLDLPISKSLKLTTLELKEIYKKKDIPEHRYNFNNIYQIALQIQKNPNLLAKYELDPEYKKLKIAVEEIIKAKPNTKYEKLDCVGLNYNKDQLVATMKIKLPYGYSGNLCTDGSNEYVAFWAYVHDDIEQMCLWRYLGTTSVNVHDIKKIPTEGLEYAVYLPADLSIFKENCHNPKVIKIRAILSWNVKPDPHNPNYNPVWGNKVDSLIQIKPASLTPNEQKPFIWALGNMAVESISGNPHTVETSSIGDGFANGVSQGGGFTAIESPFGGRIMISGKITNAPDNPSEANKLRYKVQYKKLPGGSWKDIVSDFRIWIRIDGVPSGYIDQTAIGGYFKYQEDDSLASTPPKTEVLNNLLAVWHTPVPEGDGLYAIRVLLYKSGAFPQPDVPIDHISSEQVKVLVDNTSPTAQISLDAGACEKFTPGDIITGKFTATDAHIWRYNLAILPTSIPNKPTISPIGSTYPILPVPGVVNETFKLQTKSAKPCGYVIRLNVYDRAIVNNYMQGNRKHADVGFCLLEKK